MSTKFVTVRAADVQPGDWADRRDRDLDPRPVARVGMAGRRRVITLQIGSVETSPVFASLYRFKREVPA